MLGTYSMKPSRPSAFHGAANYRDVTGQGGYVYRVFNDGRIQILQSPRGGAGTYVQPGTEAYNAILLEAYEGNFTGVAGQSRGRKVRAEDVLSTTERIVGVADVGTTIAERIAALARGQGPAAPGPELDAGPYLPSPQPETSGPPWGLILGVGGVIAGIGVLAFAFGGGD